MWFLGHKLPPWNCHCVVRSQECEKRVFIPYPSFPTSLKSWDMFLKADHYSEFTVVPGAVESTWHVYPLDIGRQDIAHPSLTQHATPHLVQQLNNITLHMASIEKHISHQRLPSLFMRSQSVSKKICLKYQQWAHEDLVHIYLDLVNWSDCENDI